MFKFNPLADLNLDYFESVESVLKPLKLEHNTETLSADRTILITDKPIQFLDADGINRNVTLPAEASSVDLVFVILNASNGVTEKLNIKDDTPTTLITLGPGQGCTVSCDGTNWKVLNDKGIYYDKIRGYVGIGTTNPGQPLDVSCDNLEGLRISSVAASMFQLYSTGTNPGTRNWALITNITQHGDFDIRQSNARLGNPFSVGTSRLHIDNNGNVGIGTASPNTFLELQKESVDAEETISVYHDTEATAPIITLRKADNTAAVPALVDDNAVLGRINFKGHDGSGWHTGAKIEARVDGTPSDGDDMPTELTFATTPEASGSPTEWMTLMPSGQLKIKESSDPGALADHVFFYGKDVAGTAEAFAADAAANAAQLTPHTFDLFEPDAQEAYPWSYYAENKALGIKINVDMAGMIRAVEKLTGKKFIYTEDIAKDVDLEEIYRDKWIESYIETSAQKIEVTKNLALETIQVDVDKLYEVETTDPKTGKVTITRERNKIGEKITGYELIDDEAKPKIEIIWESEKVNKYQIKENIEFDETDGKFYTITKTTKADAIIAAKTGFKFTPPKWLGDRLNKQANKF